MIKFNNVTTFELPTKTSSGEPETVTYNDIS